MFKGNNSITYALFNGAVVHGILQGDTTSTVHPASETCIKVPQYNIVTAHTSFTSKLDAILSQHRGRIRKMVPLILELWLNIHITLIFYL